MVIFSGYRRKGIPLKWFYFLFVFIFIFSGSLVFGENLCENHILPSTQTQEERPTFSSSSLSFGEITMDIGQETRVKRGPVLLNLAPLEAKILEVFLKDPNKPRTFQDIQDELSSSSESSHYTLESIQKAMLILKMKIGVRTLILNPSQSAFDSLTDSSSAVYFEANKDLPNSPVKFRIKKINQGFQIRSIHRNTRVISLSSTGENGEREMKTISLNKGEFSLSLRLLRHAGGALSHEQIFKALGDDGYLFSGITFLVKSLYKKFPELFVSRFFPVTINWSLLSKEIVEDYVKRPEGLQEISGVTVSDYYNTVYLSGYMYRLPESLFQHLLFVLNNPHQLFSFKDMPTNIEPNSFYGSFLLLRQIFSPLGFDIRSDDSRGKENANILCSIEEQHQRSCFINSYGFFGVKESEPTSFKLSLGEIPLELTSRTLYVGSDRYQIPNSNVRDILHSLIQQNGKIVPSIFVKESQSQGSKQLSSHSIQLREQRFVNKMRELFPQAFIVIKISTSVRSYTLGYKLAYQLEPSWVRYFNNIELDSVFYRLRLGDQTISLPYLYFKIIELILGRRQLFLNKSIQKLFFLLMEEKKRHVVLPFYLASLLRTLGSISPHLKNKFLEELEKEVPWITTTHLLETQNPLIENRLSILEAKMKVLKLHFDEGLSFNRIHKEMNLHNKGNVYAKRDLKRWIQDFEKKVCTFLKHFDSESQLVFLLSSFRTFSPPCYQAPLSDERIHTILPYFFNNPGKILSGSQWAKKILKPSGSPLPDRSLTNGRLVVSEGEGKKIKKAEEEMRSLFNRNYFIAIRVWKEYELRTLGYKLLLFREPNWHSSLFFKIEVDPVFFEIRIKGELFSLPPVHFYAFWAAIELLDSNYGGSRSPLSNKYLEEEEIISLLLLSDVVSRNSDLKGVMKKSSQKWEIERMRSDEILILNEDRSFFEIFFDQMAREFPNLRSMQSFSNIMQSYHSWIEERRSSDFRNRRFSVVPKDKIGIIQSWLYWKNWRDKRDKTEERTWARNIQLVHEATGFEKTLIEAIVTYFEFTLDALHGLYIQ